MLITLSTEGASSSVIVPIPDVSPIVTDVGLVNDRTSVSSLSSARSPFASTVTVAVDAPAVNETT